MNNNMGYILRLWASLVAQTVKNLPAMRETWVWSLGHKDPLEKVKATHWYSCLENPMDREAWWATVHGVTKSLTQLSYFTFTFYHYWFLTCTECFDSGFVTLALYYRLDNSLCGRLFYMAYVTSNHWMWITSPSHDNQNVSTLTNVS